MCLLVFCKLCCQLISGILWLTVMLCIQIVELPFRGDARQRSGRPKQMLATLQTPFSLAPLCDYPVIVAPCLSPCNVFAGSQGHPSHVVQAKYIQTARNRMG